jgi:hypothetical protein
MHVMHCYILTDITDSSRNTQLTREQIRSSLQGIVVELTAVEQLPAAVEVRWKVSSHTSHRSLTEDWILVKVKISGMKVVEIMIFLVPYRCNWRGL